MADVGSGDASNQGSSSMSTQEKVLRNKRNYLPEFSLNNQNDVSVSLTEFPRYELLAEKFQNTLSDPGSLEARANWPKEEQEVEELQLPDWDDPIACQLEELLSHNLSSTFRSAIKKIAECGYSEEVAEWAFLRSGLYYGSKDPVSNIVDGGLVFLRREKEFDTSKHHILKDFENLVEYTMLEMIYVLTEVKPCLTIAEAMWFLLICDLNLAQACALEGDPLSGFGGKEIPGESSTDCTLAQLKPEARNSEATHSTPHNTYTSEPSVSNAQFLSEIPAVGGIPKLPNPMYPFVHEVTTPGNKTLVPVPDSGGKSLGITGEYIQRMCQMSVMDEKSGNSRKGRLVNSRRDVLRQKSCHLEKSYKVHVSKGTFRAKLGTWGGLVLDKKLKSPSDSLGVSMRNISSKTSSASVTHNSAACFPKDIVSALPAASAKLYAALLPEKKRTPKPQVSVPGPKPLDYYAGIPYDKSLGKYVPLDEKDKLILTLVPQLQELQKELQGWTAWSNEKVMQAARRLSKDQAELKKLRQEKEETEKFKKENQVFEESTLKRLSEMEYALSNATGQVEMANSTAHKLEEENFILKKEMETARLHAIGSAANLQEALLREQEALKRAQSWETQKSLLQEVSTDKRKVAELQHLLEKAKGLYSQFEARHKQEERVKEKHLIMASSIIKEREQQESLAKAEEDMIRKKAENEMQKYKEDIKKLESKLSEWRLESESSKIAALRRGINGSYCSYLADCKDSPAFKGYQAPKVTKRLAVFHGNFGARSARVERECVMCLTEEMSVVFLPCAHQVLCANCSELHQKQGMSDCPSCRTPINRRINVHFASP